MTAHKGDLLTSRLFGSSHCFRGLDPDKISATFTNKFRNCPLPAAAARDEQSCCRRSYSLRQLSQHGRDGMVLNLASRIF